MPSCIYECNFRQIFWSLKISFFTSHYFFNLNKIGNQLLQYLKNTFKISFLTSDSFKNSNYKNNMNLLNIMSSPYKLGIGPCLPIRDWNLFCCAQSKGMKTKGLTIYTTCVMGLCFYYLIFQSLIFVLQLNFIQRLTVHLTIFDHHI